MAEKILKTARDQLINKWFVCRIASGRKSAQYGIRFSYPLYISFVAFGVITENIIILTVTAFVALLGILLPMHPLDYVFNFGISNLFGFKKIPGRGSEMQVNSVMSLFFNLYVIYTLISGLRLNYGVMALFYVLISAFFITVLLLTDNFSFYSLFNYFSKRKK